MKFRNKFSRYMVVAWESHYVPYQQLKASLKNATRNGCEPSAAVYTSFLQAIVANTAFSQQRQSILQHDEKHVENLYDDHAIMEHHWNLLYLSLISLRDALVELVWFYRINYEAMNRIQTKLVKSGLSHSQELEECRRSIREHIAQYREAYKSCVDQLDRVQNRVAALHRVVSDDRVDPLSLDRNYQAVAAMFPNKGFVTQDGSSLNSLHIAAMYGMVNLCMHLLSTGSPIERYILSRDEAGISPLQTSVARGHIEVAELLLSATDVSSPLIPGDLLHIALRREDEAMVKLLLSKNLGVEHRSSTGENCLHVAAELGREDFLGMLLPMFKSDSVDATESSCLWTPLFIGCVEGHVSTVRMLLDAGADPTRLDYLGWTAQENAAFRGHLSVAELFSVTSATAKVSSTLPSSIPPRERPSLVDASPGLWHVVVNLGSLQERGVSKFLTLNHPDTHGHGLSLSISSSESITSFERMLPLLDDPVDDTLVFTFKDLSKAAVVFSIRQSDAEQEDHGTLLGTGIALLYTQSMCLDLRHSTLVREQSVPILCRDTLRLLGTIDFSYLMIGPYSRLEHSTPSVTCLEDAGSAQLVGHRGLGQNSRERCLQLGENTIGSFLAARKQGANFVEVTKDLIPVLFHDYSLSESGTDVPIHDVTLDQFLHVSNIQSPRGNPPSIVKGLESHRIHFDFDRCRPRSRSITATHESGAEQVKIRMKHTIDYLNKGFKPNTRGDFVQDTFATLKEVLCNIPEDVGFDMEIKYPRIHEAVEAGIAPISIDINLFVDTILDTVAQFGGDRSIVLSSFTPDVCILLAVKQKSYPVLFITNAGKLPLSDKEKRTGSLQVAIRFAKQWSLAGIVVAADSLVLCPRLISFIRSQGLVCGSYNALNNDPKNVVVQANAGIDLIVADRVGLISQVLKRLVI